ncbi:MULTISPECIES: hypothetical protein [unclassified Streptomyces]|uniref:hypothetical protein n=1 Tax=unclassified Streptomyces TaxID=2593676 RepID=UPI002255073A|nr:MULTISPECIES: hypothetical protein [unclassified Streptomyces]MCX5149749.1 hypothetical protein [Streptomyces sp. NBC_00320]WSN52784.1 hypothetical protein OG299_36420 [Streptomyces sp. NBC_01296]WSW57707.1 hypothetical protein OG513_03495 [Streptomyces sp. NBC_00998]
MIAKRTGRLVVLAAVPAAAVFLTVGLSGPALAEGGKAYQIDLAQLNNSGSRGTAMLSLKGNQLTVQIESEGMVPGSPSAQHLHGSTNGHDFQCPDASDDTNGDGILSNTEATVDYGDINISLTTIGDTQATSGLAVERMPIANKQGKVSYKRTITVSQAVVDHLKDLHIVQHGIDRNKNGKYDFEGAGKSELDPKLPQEATAPTNCGMVMGASVGSLPVGGVETGGGAPQSAAAPATVISGAALAVSAALAGAASGAVFVARRRAASARVRTQTTTAAAA